MNYEVIIKDNRAIILSLNEDAGDEVNTYDDRTTSIRTKKVKLNIPTVNSYTIEGDLSFAKDFAAALVGQDGLITSYNLETNEKEVTSVQITNAATYRLKPKKQG